MTRSKFLDPVTLAGSRVRLTPLSVEHADGLCAAVCDGELWKLWYTFVPEPEGMLTEIERRLALAGSGTMIPFTVMDVKTGRIAGMTTYMNVDATHQRVEIGSTWYARSVQRSSLNTEAKLLLLEHAFDKMSCIAVEFRTHALNQQSRRAIERLGAKLDGVLRNHMRMPNGTLRDTCVYSILSSEWPTVRAHLNGLLARPPALFVE